MLNFIFQNRVTDLKITPYFYFFFFFVGYLSSLLVRKKNFVYSNNDETKDCLEQKKNRHIVLGL